METEFDFEALVREVLANRDARTACSENRLRRTVAGVLEESRRNRGLSVRDLATAMNTSVSEVQRLLHHEVGGGVTLRTVCRAVDALGMRVSIHIRDGQPAGGKVVPFGSVAWGDIPYTEVADEDRAIA